MFLIYKLESHEGAELGLLAQQAGGFVRKGGHGLTPRGSAGSPWGLGDQPPLNGAAPEGRNGELVSSWAG